MTISVQVIIDDGRPCFRMSPSFASDRGNVRQGKVEASHRIRGFPAISKVQHDDLLYGFMIQLAILAVVPLTIKGPMTTLVTTLGLGSLVDRP
jgi:hypothetical protein